MRLALYQPDIAPNVGTLIRLGACLGVAVDIIEPCGFPADDRTFRRAAMDYAQMATVVRHLSWTTYLDARGGVGVGVGGDDGNGDGDGTGRLVLLTTGAGLSYTEFGFRAGDTLLVGQESSGVPKEIHALADARIMVPMTQGARSLNVAVAAAMVLGEALRQTCQMPAVAGKQMPAVAGKKD